MFLDLFNVVLSEHGGTVAHDNIPSAQNPRERKLGPEQKLRNLVPTMADQEVGLVDLELDLE